MAEKVLLWRKLLIICCMFNIYYCHPQCLDYQPPFQAAANDVTFCGKHKNYGCCTATRDKDIKHDYNYLVQRLNGRISTLCESLIKELLCLECHPYASHIFDAERLTADKLFEKRNVNFPGLCYNSCMGFFDECRDAIAFISRTNEFSTFVKNSTAHEFCEWATIPDVNYCYPDINNLQQQSYAPLSDYITLCVEPFTNIFRNPLFAVTPYDNTHRMFIGEQQGVIYVLEANNRKRDTPFLNISSRIINSGSPWDERGLLGMAFHPKYKRNGRFFLYYSAPKDNVNRSAISDFEWYWRTRHLIRVSEFTVSPTDPNIADMDSELVILEVEQPESNHNGGMLLFDKQGYLNIFIGDGGGAGDPHGTIGNGLNLTTLLGKVARLDIDSENELYSIPPDNPFRMFPGVRDEIFAYGIRNIWRCSLDKIENIMLCGDVGQNKYEEINIIEKGGNYGWRAFEGYACYDNALCTRHHKNLKFPILVYNHSVGQSIVGGYVYRGCRNPHLVSKYFFADTMNGRIFAAQKGETGDWEQVDVAMGNESICKYPFTNKYTPHILSFGESESGEILILSTGYPDPNFPTGRIYRLVDPLKRSDPTFCVFDQKAAKPLKKVRRRNVYYRTRDLPIPGEICRDERRTLCERYFKNRSRSSTRYACNSFSFARKYCKKTCQYC